MHRAICLALLLLSCQKRSGKGLERVHIPNERNGRDGVHGMVLFGERESYVSHIPMFHEPHDVQLVARVRVTGVEGRVPHDFGSALHTLSPERFRLDSVLSGKETSFRADVYRGNFENGGEKLGTAYIEVESILVARPLGGVDSNDEYYVFGTDGEWWAVHRVGASPSFDAVSRVSFAKSPAAGRYLKNEAGRLSPGDTLRGAGGTFSVTMVHDLSCLVGPDFMAPCP